jgi:hypothetical protein
MNGGTSAGFLHPSLVGDVGLCLPSPLAGIPEEPVIEEFGVLYDDSPNDHDIDFSESPDGLGKARASYNDEGG